MSIVSLDSKLTVGLSDVCEQVVCLCNCQVITLYYEQFLCRLRSIVAKMDHFVRRMSVRPSVCPCVCTCGCLSGSNTSLVVTHSYVSEATHAFLIMLPPLFFMNMLTSMKFIYNLLLSINSLQQQ